MSRFGSAIALCILSFPFACGDKILPTDPNAPKGGAGGTTTVPPAVSYAQDIQPLLEKYCTSCHSSSGGQNPYLDTYTTAKNGAASSLAEVQNGGMPPGSAKMQPSEVALLEAWINAQEPQ
jgi:hypothetical protein